MLTGKTFASLIILLSLGAAIEATCHGDYRRAIYWAAAAVLNLSVMW